MPFAKRSDMVPSLKVDTPFPPPHPTSPPFHIVPGLSNFRDIGGWPIVTSPGAPQRRVRKGILFRGSDTNRITLEGVKELQQLGIRTDFDLRSKQQIENTGGYKEIPGIQRRWTPVFAEEEYTEEAARRRYELYAGEGTIDIVTAFVEVLTAGAPMMKSVLLHVLSLDMPVTPPAAIFMHCTTGNNRTGVFVSLLLLLLGVSSELVAHEYALSEAGLAPTRYINVQRLLKKGAFQEYEPDEARRKCNRMVGARKESMHALLVEVKTRWGGAEGYFTREVGLSRDELERVKSLFTEEDEERIADEYVEQ